MEPKQSAIVLVILVCGLVGCGTGSRAEQSAFRATFSLGSIVGASEHLVLPGARVSSGSEAGPSEPFTQASEVMTIQVDSTNIVAFMEAIQFGIQESLASSQAELLGGGGTASGDPTGSLPDPFHFWFSYRDGAVDGAIHVWGVPGTGSSLVLIVTIVES